MKRLTERLEPRWTKSRIEKLDPIFTNPSTDMALPALATVLKLTPLPNVMKSRTEKVDPMRPNP
jgi:hypothetical protein